MARVLSYKRTRGSRYKPRSKYQRYTVYGRYKSAGSGSVPRSIGRAAMRNTTALTRMCEYEQVDIGVAGDILGAKKFMLSDLPDVAEFSLFDQFRINAIKIEFTITSAPATTEVESAGAPALTHTGSPFFYTAIDTDDATVPSSKNAVLQYDSCRFHGNLNCNMSKVVRWLKPQVATTYYKGITAGYGARTSPWIDVQGSSAVEHYGIKWALTSLTAMTNTKLVMVATFYLEFRMAQ